MSYTYSFSGVGSQPTLEYDVTDATTGAPMRVTLLSGTVVLKLEVEGFIQPQFYDEVPLGLFLPATPPLAAGPDPIIVTEMSVCYHWTDQDNRNHHGVSKILAQVHPDPQRSGQRGVYLSFSVVGGAYLGLRYRVTLFRPRP